MKKSLSKSQRIAEKLAVVYELSCELTLSVDIDRISNAVLDIAQKSPLNFDNCALVLIDESTKELYTQAQRGYSEDIAKFRAPLNYEKGVTAWVARTGRSIYLPDVRQNRRYIPGVPGGRSELAVPLKIEEKIIGVLDVESKEINAFSEGDQELLSCLASQAAVAIQSARNFNELEKKTKQLSVLLNACMALSSSLSSKLILHNLAEKLTTSMPTTFCRVSLLDERTQELTVVSAFAIRPLEWESGISERYPMESNSYYSPCVKNLEILVLRADENEEELSDFEQQIALRNGLQSLLLMPLAAGRKALGMAWLGEVRNWKRSSFTPEKVNLCRAIADRGAIAIERALLHEQLRENHAHLRSEVEERYKFGNIIGKSPNMKKVFKLLKRVIVSSVSVLIEGETGAGKDVVAKTIHYSGPRRRKRFVPIDCGAIPETLVESELFGYRKGAFTGAKEDRKGLFEEADGGTLFLDEIGNMKPAMQAKLLRALQEGEIRRIGEARTRKVDVRVISASSKNLEEEVHKGTFREDLLFRLNVVTVQLPPLRERLEDIPLLAYSFLKKYAQEENKKIDGFSPKAMDLLMSYDYHRNNVRELENIVERAVVMERSKIIKPESLSFVEDRGVQSRQLTSIEEWVKAQIIQTLRHTGWNKKKACDILGISRPTLDRKIKKYRILKER